MNIVNQITVSINASYWIQKLSTQISANHYRSTCQFILKKGVNRGSLCQNRPIKGSVYCSRHNALLNKNKGLAHTELHYDDYATEIGKFDKFDDVKRGTPVPRKHIEIKDDECPICLDNISSKDKQYLSCFHAFHKSCIDGWFLTEKACPICRQTM